MKIKALMCEYLNEPMAIDNPKPRFSWQIESDGYDIMQTEYRITVSDKPFEDGNDGTIVWDSGVVSEATCFDVVYGGAPLLHGKTYYWRVLVHNNNDELAVSKTAQFGMGIKNEDWQGGFIGQDVSETVITDEVAANRAGAASPYLRKIVSIDKPLRSAKAFATAYGVYELHVNGRRVGNYHLAPGWTDYRRSLEYQCYDITEYMQSGKNAVGAILGDGWYTGNIAITGRKQYGDYPLGLRLCLRLEFTDGTVETVGTDTSWRVACGAIRYSDMQSGEMIDATKELNGWDLPEYDDSDWNCVISIERFADAVLRAQEAPMIREMQTVSAKSVTPHNDVQIVDFGQNLVGVARLHLKTKRGDKVTLRFGEMLCQDGSLYTENLRSALQTDIYIASGDINGEIFEPHFTIHGFRYAEVKGLKYTLSADDIKAIVIHADCLVTGKIETSSKLVNQIYSNQFWGQCGNFVSVPTDCPQRDERMGWTGDTQIFAQTACYNMHCAAFYEKYIKDCLEAQKPNGAITDVVPVVRVENGNDLVGSGTAAWGDVIFILPWVVYRAYGDRRILVEAYNGMLRYLAYLEESATDFIRPDSGYGDWLNVDEDTPRDVLSTAYFAYAAALTAQVARVLGKPEDAEHCERLANAVKKAFRKAFVDDEGIIKGDTQCCYILALKMDLLPKEERSRAARHLVRTIERRDWHLATGFVGISYLLDVLCEAGYDYVAYRLLLNETYPSWGYSISNGATTIWERWNSYTKEDGFGDVEMNSFNHYSLGSVGAWMYRMMAGIREEVPGFRRIRIQPYFTSRLDRVSAEYQSQSGLIKSSWERNGNVMQLSVQIPANTTARVYLKSDGCPKVQKGTAVAYGNDSNYTVFTAGSGLHVFEIEVVE